MAPSNFKSIDTQKRLLAAVLAAHPTLKLNYKAITLHFGSDVTESIIRHRLRPIKMQADVVREAVSRGEDAKDLDHIFSMNEKEIQKYFGESTPQGIEFQFRTIKKDAKALRNAVDRGESPLTASLSAASTPSKRKTSPLTMGSESGSGGRSAKRAAAVAGTAAYRQLQATHLVFSNEEDSSLSDDVDYEQLDLTPVATPTPRQNQKPPKPAAAILVTPKASSSASVSFATDATPALTASATPSDSVETPETQKPLFSRQVADAIHVGMDRKNVFTVDDNDDLARYDDEDDDGVFVLDTPSKMPKTATVMSAPVPTPASLAAASVVTCAPVAAPTPATSFSATTDYGWSGFDHTSLAESSHTFGTSSASWAHNLYGYGASESFSNSMLNSFDDNDGAV